MTNKNIDFQINEKRHISFEQNMKSEKSITGFEPAAFRRPVQTQTLHVCNAIPTRLLGT